MLAQSILTSLRKKWPVFLLWSLTFLTSTVVCQAQFFTESGDFGYSLNSENHVFDVTADGTRAVALTSTGHDAWVTSFDPVTGTKFDSKLAGFGGENVNIAETADGTRVVILTNEGGPNTITIYNMDQDGKLTRLAKQRLTNSNADFSGNLVLSPQGGVGFNLVLTENYAHELVVFSLNNGAILKRFSINGYTERYLGMKEANGKRTLVFTHYASPSAPPDLAIVDATDLAQLAVVGNVPLPRNTEWSASDFVDFAFSADSRYVFVANQFIDFAAVDLVGMQVVDKIGGSYRFSHVSITENSSRRLVALISSPTGTGGYSATVLVDATDPANLKVIKKLSEPFYYLTFSKSGNQLLGIGDTTLKSLLVPSLSTIWVEQIPDPDENLPQQIMAFGQPERVIGAWGVFTSLFGSFPVGEADLSITKYGAHGVLTGANINYFFRVKNNGPTAATGVTLTDKLPAGLSLVAATPSAGVCRGTTTLVCDFGELPIGASRTVKITATPTKAGQFINTATVQSKALDSIPSNNVAEQSTTLVPVALTLNPSTVFGPCQSSITGRVSISSPAPGGGVVVNVTDNNPAATTPGNVTIPAGKTSVDFPIQITPASSIRTGTVSAIYNGHSFGVKLTVLPTTGVRVLSFTPNPASSGQTVTGKVVLACKATTDTVVTLSSSDPATASPTVTSINIPAGATSRTFTIDTAGVSQPSTVIITAKANGISKSASLTVVE